MNQQLAKAKTLARNRWGSATPYRLGLVASLVGLNENPYPEGFPSHRLFEQGVAWTGSDLIKYGNWPCGHPKTPSNTQSVGVAGKRCRICRQRICAESRARMKEKRNGKF